MRRVTAPAGRIAVVGAGASQLVAQLAGDGYHVIAFDIAPAAVAALRTQLADELTAGGHVDCRVADVRTVRFDEPVDTWHDRAVFHFLIDPADQRAYVASAALAVRPHGHLVIATFAPSGPDSCSGLPVARHDAASLGRVFGGAFELVEAFESDHVTPSGSTQRFTHAVLRRRTDARDHPQRTATDDRRRADASAPRPISERASIPRASRAGGLRPIRYGSIEISRPRTALTTASSLVCASSFAIA